MGTLQERFLCPPFSVFDTKQRYWQKRKQEWAAAGLNGQAGRRNGILSKGKMVLAEQNNRGVTGTSVFDPVLCEVLYSWYGIPGGVAFDPFAGGPARGVVAEMYGLTYVGIDLSPGQIAANRENGDQLGIATGWVCDDSRNADQYLPDGTADLVLTCPPYHNLEKYSDRPDDLSNMSYEDFADAYREIISISCRKLKDNRFAVFVVGDIRDKKGAYRDFIGLTTDIFLENGLCLYNSSILLEMFGTAPIIAARTFTSGRKVVKVHQNVLVFYKGNPKNIKGTFKNEFQFVDLSHLM